MKKTLIALAAVAAMGAASAEVTFYGLVDLGLQNVTKTDAVDKGVELVSGAYNSSRLGLKGSTDLSGGLKASFQLEEKLTDAAADFTATQGRVSTLAISGAFGTVSAGAMWSPYDNAMNDALNYNGFSALGATLNAGVHSDNGNGGESGSTKNAVQFQTADMNGFNAVVLYAPTKNSVTNADTSYVGLGLNYAKGPLTLAFAAEKTDNANLNADVGTPTLGFTNAYVLTGMYNLGAASVSFGYDKADAGFAKDTGYSLGVSVPVGAMTVAAGYAIETTSYAAAADSKASSFGAHLLYPLAKTVTYYAGARQVTDNVTGKDIVTNKVATGVSLSF